MSNSQQPKSNPLLAAVGLHGLPWGWWAKFQLRSHAKGHEGWWIDMGSTNHFAYRDESGAVSAGSAIYIGPSSEGKDYGRFLVRGLKGVPDGILHIHSSKIVPIQAMISDQDIAALGYDVSHLTPDADEIVDLSTTRIDPITEADLLVASSKLEPLGNLQEEARKRGELANATHADLGPEDIVYDELTKSFGKILTVTPDNDKISATVRWQGNRITTTKPVSKDQPVRVWKAPAEEVSEQEMAGGPEKGRFKGIVRDLKPGDVFENGAYGKILVEKVQSTSGGFKEVYFKDAKTGKLSKTILDTRKQIDISRGMGDEPGQQKPSTKPIETKPAQARLMTSDDVRKLNVGDEIFVKKKGAKGFEQYHVNSKGFIQKGGYDADVKATTSKTTPDDLAEMMDAGEYESVFFGRIPVNPEPTETKATKGKKEEPATTTTPTKPTIDTRTKNSKGQKVKVKYANELKYGDVLVKRDNVDEEIGVVIGYEFIVQDDGQQGKNVYIQKLDGTFGKGFAPDGGNIKFIVAGSRPDDITEENIDKLPLTAVSAGKKNARNVKGKKKKQKVAIPDGPLVVPDEIVSQNETANPPTKRQFDSILRRLRMGIFEEQRAKEIVANLPFMSSTQIGAVIKEADELEILHLISKKEPIDAIRFPKVGSDSRDVALDYLKTQQGTAISGAPGSSGYLGEAIKYEIADNGDIYIIHPGTKSPYKPQLDSTSGKRKALGFVWNSRIKDSTDSDGNVKINKATGEPYYDQGWVRVAKDGESDSDRAAILAQTYKDLVFASPERPSNFDEEDRPESISGKSGQIGQTGVFYEILPSGDISFTGKTGVHYRAIRDTAVITFGKEDADVKAWILKSKKQLEDLKTRAANGDQKAIIELQKYEKFTKNYDFSRNPDFDKSAVLIQIDSKNTAISSDDIAYRILKNIEKKLTGKTEEDKKEKPSNGYEYKVLDNGNLVISGDLEDPELRKKIKEHARKTGTNDVTFDESNKKVTVELFGDTDEENESERERLISGIKQIIAEHLGKPAEPEGTEEEREKPEPAAEEKASSANVEENKKAWKEATDLFIAHNKAVAEKDDKKAKELRDKLEKASVDYSDFILLNEEREATALALAKAKAQDKGKISSHYARVVALLKKYTERINNGKTTGNTHPGELSRIEDFDPNRDLWYTKGRGDVSIPSPAVEKPKTTTEKKEKETVAEKKEKEEEPLPEKTKAEKPKSNNGMRVEEPTTDISRAAGLKYSRTTGDSVHPTEVDKNGNPKRVYSPSPGPFMGGPLREKIASFDGDYGKIEEFISNSRVVSFDTETTGFNDFDGDGQLNRVVQWGFVLHKPDGTEERFSFFVRPSDGAKLSEWSKNNLVRPVYDEKGNVVETTPLTDEWLATQPTEEEILPMILDILKDNPILVAHNIQYDLPLLHELVDRVNAKRGDDDKVKLSFAGAIDTMELSRYTTPTYDPGKGVLDGPTTLIDKAGDKNLPENRRSSAELPAVLDFLGLKPSGWHTADGDALDSLRALGGLLSRAANNPESIPANGRFGVGALDFEKIDQRYTKALEEFNRVTDRNAPATPRQKSAKAKQGFADMLRKRGITDEAEIEKILAPIQNMTRGQAADYISKVREDLDSKNLVSVQEAKKESESKKDDKDLAGAEPLNDEDIPNAVSDVLKNFAGYDALAKYKLDGIKDEKELKDYVKQVITAFKELSENLGSRILSRAIEKFNKGPKNKESISILFNEVQQSFEKLKEEALDQIKLPSPFIKNIMKTLGDDKWTEAFKYYVNQAETIFKNKLNTFSEFLDKEEEKINAQSGKKEEALEEINISNLIDNVEPLDDNKIFSAVAEMLNNSPEARQLVVKYNYEPIKNKEELDKWLDVMSKMTSSMFKELGNRLLVKAIKDFLSSSKSKEDIERIINNLQNSLSKLRAEIGSNSSIVSPLAEQTVELMGERLWKNAIVSLENIKIKNIEHILNSASNFFNNPEKSLEKPTSKEKTKKESEELGPKQQGPEEPEPKEPSPEEPKPEEPKPEDKKKKEKPENTTPTDVGELVVGDRIYSEETGNTYEVADIKDSMEETERVVKKKVNGKEEDVVEKIQVPLVGFSDVTFKNVETGEIVRKRFKKSRQFDKLQKEEPGPKQQGPEEPGPKQQGPEEPTQPTPSTPLTPPPAGPEVLDEVQKLGDPRKSSEVSEKLVKGGYAKSVKASNLKIGDYIYHNDRWQKITNIRFGRIYPDGTSEMDIDVEDPIGGYTYKLDSNANTLVLTPAAFKGGPSPIKSPEEPKATEKEPEKEEQKKKSEPESKPKKETPRQRREIPEEYKLQPLSVDLSGLSDEDKIIAKNAIDAMYEAEALLAEVEGRLLSLDTPVYKGYDASLDQTAKLDEALADAGVVETDSEAIKRFLNTIPEDERNGLLYRLIDFLNGTSKMFQKDEKKESRLEKRWKTKQEQKAIKEEKRRARNLTFTDMANMLDVSAILQAMMQEREDRVSEEKRETLPVENSINDIDIDSDVSKINDTTIEGAQELFGYERNIVENAIFGSSGTTPEDYIPNKEKDPVGYEDSYKKFVKDYLTTDSEENRSIFEDLVEISRVVAADKKYRVAKVSGTQTYIRWTDGDIDPNALKDMIEEIQKINKRFGLQSQKIGIVATPTMSFGPGKKLVRAAEPSLGITEVKGYSLPTENSFIVAINPDIYTQEVSDDTGVRSGPSPKNYLINTLIHEMPGHGIAQLVIGQNENRLLGKSDVGLHSEDWEEFIKEFGHLVGDDKYHSHPVSGYGSSTQGENFAELLKAAYLALEYNDGNSSDETVAKFIKFLEKKLSKGFNEVGKRNQRSDEELFDQEMAGSSPEFPPISGKTRLDMIESNFYRRASFYDGELTPYGDKLNSRDSKLIKTLYKEVIDNIVKNKLNPSDENKNNVIQSMRVLEQIYDSLFIAYSRRNPRYNVETIKERISQKVTTETYRKWSSARPFIPGGKSDKSNKYGNEIAIGTYNSEDSGVYHLAYIRTVDLSDPDNTREKVMVVASKPNQSRDEFIKENASLRDILESGTGVLTIGHFLSGSEDEKTYPDSLEIHGIEVDSDYRGNGIATALLAFARSNNKKRILHSTKPTINMEAWARSVDKSSDNHTRRSRLMDRYGTSFNNEKAEPAIKELEDGTTVWPDRETPLVSEDYYSLPEFNLDRVSSDSYSPEELSALKALFSKSDVADFEDELASLFNRPESKLSKPTYLYSGAHGGEGSNIHNMLFNRKAGDVIDMSDFYTIASQSAAVAHDDMGPGLADNDSGEEGFMLIIRAPRGSRVVSSPKGMINQDRKKTILDKNSRFKVVKVRRSNRKDKNGLPLSGVYNTTLEVELLPGNERATSSVPKIGKNRSIVEEQNVYSLGLEFSRNINPNLTDYKQKDALGLGYGNSAVGYVKTDVLSSMAGNKPDNEEKLKDKLEDISSGTGIKKPVVVFYDPETGLGYVQDGNHRVEAASRNNISHVPTRVVRSKDPITLTSHPTAKKLGRNWSDPATSKNNLPKNIHPYFIFSEKDVLGTDESSSDEIIQEMVEGAVRIDLSPENRDELHAFLKADSKIMREQVNPGTYVKTPDGRIGKVVRYKRIEEGPDKGSYKNDEVEVRFLDGMFDVIDDPKTPTTNYDQNGERVRVIGKVDPVLHYNDKRQYTEKIYKVQDLTPVTKAFTSSGGTPIMLDDTMYGVISGTGIMGRINRFLDEGVIEVAELINIDKYGLGEYKFHKVEAKNFLPIQGRRESLDSKQTLLHTEDMKINIQQKAQLYQLMSVLQAYGYLPEDYREYIANITVRGGFATRSGAEELIAMLSDLELYRRKKVEFWEQKHKRDNKAPSQSKYFPDEPEIEEVTTEAEKVNPVIKNISEFRSAANINYLNNDIPHITSLNKKDPAADEIMARIQRIIYEEGVISDSEANKILSKLPNMSQSDAENLLEKLQADLLNKRIARDEPIDGLEIPDGYNTSKLENYSPTDDLPPDADIADMADFLDQKMKDAIAIVQQGDPGGLEKHRIVEQILSERENIFISGGAGVGKSVLLNLLKAYAKLRGIKLETVAPTGTAAELVNGSTIHRLFGFDYSIQSVNFLGDMLKQLEKYAPDGAIGSYLKTLDMLAIDEISMVRPDLLDAIDRAFRLAKGIDKPFGGVTVVMFGDPYQLPPIVNFGSSKNSKKEQLDEGDKLFGEREDKRDESSKEFDRLYPSGSYFFNAHVFAGGLQVKELKTVYRQKSDTEEARNFVKALNDVRKAKATKKDIEIINTRVIEDRNNLPKNSVIITAKRKMAEFINRMKSSQNTGKQHTFKAQFPEGAKLGPNDELFADPEITIKEGDNIILTKNDNKKQRIKSGMDPKAAGKAQNRWTNGTQAKFIKFVPATGSEEAHLLVSRINRDGSIDSKVLKVFIDSEDIKGITKGKVFDEELRKDVDSIRHTTQGQYKQFPVMLGYAATVHKVQGKTLDHAIIDFYEPVYDEKTGELKGFKVSTPWDAGMTYVALSRITSLQGLALTRPIELEDIKFSPEILQFMQKADAAGEDEK